MSKTTKRYWRRNDTPRSWWPWGLLPLVALAAVFVFGAVVTAPDIQAEVRNSVMTNLENASVSIRQITADGQQVRARIDGSGPNKVFMEGLAGSTKCDTWAGALTCPSAVTLDVDPAEATPAIATMRPHQFEVVRDTGAVILRGEVPSAAERERIVSLAGGYFDQVNDQMHISNDTAGAHYAPAADRAIASVSHLVSGQANWSGERLSISGSAQPGDVAGARASFEGA
ncbi:MAG: hypothetical protein OEM63_04125, partial [Gammaproteobacteria bacterium]|nr:hypothetical protein [Gammaproteobacteria bacterium]